MRSKFAALALSLSALAAATGARSAIQMQATYFSVAPGGDFGTTCCSFHTNMVQPTLGPSGMPVINVGYGGPAIQQVNGAGEIQWWTPGAQVTQTGTQVVTLPFSDFSMFTPNGAGGSTGATYQTAILQGVLNVPTTQTVTFTFGSDDDAFIALNNTVISQLGGVHGHGNGPVTTSVLAPGAYNLTVFYADRFPTAASLFFRVDTQNVSIAPGVIGGVPEPTTWALMIGGLGGAGVALRARRRTAPARSKPAITKSLVAGSGILAGAATIAGS